MLSASDLTHFQRWILDFHTQYGRHTLPWRQTADPYQVMVSELMLQQTQVDRVIPKFLNWISIFPTVQVLAQATPAQVIIAWQGLGYNRRGLNLHKAAQKIVTQHNGQIPPDLESLENLPGIGPYTASAIRAFAFDLPAVVIETNIRAVYLYHFFPNDQKVSDKQLSSLVSATLPPHTLVSTRVWYSALMDYGAFLKKNLPNPSRRSQHYTKQSKFDGSLRQVRGQILKQLSSHTALNYLELEKMYPDRNEQFKAAVSGLLKDGFLTYNQETQLLQLQDT